MKVAGYYGFLLCTQGTFRFKPRGSSWSSPLRSDGSRDNQAGEAGLVEPQLSGGQEAQN
jgi:hypothetical protein